MARRIAAVPNLLVIAGQVGTIVQQGTDQPSLQVVDVQGDLQGPRQLKRDGSGGIEGIRMGLDRDLADLGNVVDAGGGVGTQPEHQIVQEIGPGGKDGAVLAVGRPKAGHGLQIKRHHRGAVDQGRVIDGNQGGERSSGGALGIQGGADPAVAGGVDGVEIPEVGTAPKNPPGGKIGQNTVAGRRGNLEIPDVSVVGGDVRAEILDAQLIHQTLTVTRVVQAEAEIVPGQKGLFFAGGQPVGHELGVVGPLGS